MHTPLRIPLLLAALLVGATPVHAQSGTASTIADGAWEDPDTWGATKPWSSVAVNVYRMVALSTNTMEYPEPRVAHSGGFVIGDPSTNVARGAGTVIITAGGVYTGTGSTTIARNMAPLNESMTGDGFLHINGGAFFGAGVAMATGTSNTFTGRARVENGGTYSATGNNNFGAPGTTAGQKAHFEVVGAGNTINMGVLLQRNGEVRFYFDASGISTIHVAGHASFTDPNAAIRINGSAYTGGPGSWTLIAAGPDTDYSDIIDRTTVTGFDPSLASSLAIDGNNLVFNLAEGDPPVGVAISIADGSDIALAFDSLAGFSYQLEKSLNDLHSWAPLGDPIPGSDLIQLLIDAGAVPAAGTGVFYRVLRVQTPGIPAEGEYYLAYAEPTPNAQGVVGRAEIQALIDWMSTNLPQQFAGYIHLRSGVYELDAPLRISFDGVSLSGDGDSTVLRIMGNHAAIHIDQRVTTGGGLAVIRYPIIENMRIEAADPGLHGTDAIYLEYTARVDLKNLTIANVYNGIRLDRGLTHLFEDILMQDLRGEYGIWIHGELTGSTSATRLHAPTLYRIRGELPGVDNPDLVWLRVGPNAHSVEIHAIQFSGGGRGVELLTFGITEEERSSAKPLFFYTHNVTIRDTVDEAFYFEDARQVLMLNTVVSGVQSADGILFDAGFTGQVSITNLDLEDVGRDGLRIAGGRDYLLNNLRIADTGATHPGAAALSCGPGVWNVRVLNALMETRDELAGSGRMVHGLYTQGDPAARNLLALGIQTVNLPIPQSPSNWERNPLE